MEAGKRTQELQFDKTLVSRMAASLGIPETGILLLTTCCTRMSKILLLAKISWRNSNAQAAGRV